ncbi:MAG: desulfoferrodoxin FeS4 iron-binding domain-containing protein [Oscillospiraceae bacterium]|nr:desulfoferrodoxin FeS4 iron-binding domain-containing protein [Oscillospiraceae bacterium]
MKNKRKFYRCNHCGNLVSFIENSGVSIICCGEPMTELIPNTTDAAQEKHVPVATKNDGKLNVKVGSVPHPMTKEHHIGWIAVAEENRTTRITLPVNGAPEAEFCVGDGAITVYAYCNLHGLWVTEL